MSSKSACICIVFEFLKCQCICIEKNHLYLNWNLEKQRIWFGWVVFDPKMCMCIWTQPWFQAWMWTDVLTRPGLVWHETLMYTYMQTIQNLYSLYNSIHTINNAPSLKYVTSRIKVCIITKNPPKSMKTLLILHSLLHLWHRILEGAVIISIHVAIISAVLPVSSLWSCAVLEAERDTCKGKL